jgi:hypothetical protein
MGKKKRMMERRPAQSNLVDRTPVMLQIIYARQGQQMLTLRARE